MFNVPHIAFGQDLVYVSQMGNAPKMMGHKDDRVLHARKWFAKNCLRFPRSLSFLSAYNDTGITVFVVLEGGAREITEANKSKKEEILDLVGGWSFEELEL
jgi:hypothetical protein